MGGGGPARGEIGPRGEITEDPGPPDDPTDCVLADREVSLTEPPTAVVEGVEGVEGDNGVSPLKLVDAAA
jgi:hypothetical protein